MTATLPASLLAAHVVSPTEWAQILRAITALSNIAVFNSLGTCTLSSTSTSYVDVTGATQSFTKQYDASTSDVVVLLAVASLRTTAATQTTFGVNDGTTDHDVAKFNWNTANKHNQVCGFAVITGLAAGGYTFTLRAKGSAANTMTINSSDTVCMLFLETAK